jgi:hypothetical protein
MRQTARRRSSRRSSQGANADGQNQQDNHTKITANTCIYGAYFELYFVIFMPLMMLLHRVEVPLRSIRWSRRHPSSAHVATPSRDESHRHTHAHTRRSSPIDARAIYTRAGAPRRDGDRSALSEGERRDRSTRLEHVHARDDQLERGAHCMRTSVSSSAMASEYRLPSCRCTDADVLSSLVR